MCFSTKFSESTFLMQDFQHNNLKLSSNCLVLILFQHNCLVFNCLVFDLSLCIVLKSIFIKVICSLYIEILGHIRVYTAYVLHLVNLYKAYALRLAAAAGTKCTGILMKRCHMCPIKIVRFPRRLQHLW